LDAAGLRALIGQAATRQGLRLRADAADPGWTIWELKNLNLHRALVLIEPQADVADPVAFLASLRAGLASSLHRAWWRGLACCVIVAAPGHLAWLPADLTPMVDGREEWRAIVQWLIAASLTDRTAIGMHTWLEVRLSPTYRDLIRAFRADGFAVTTAVKGRDGLMRLLTDVAALEGTPFPEYRDR
jgi:hypothetical protein